jgi:hypothetical protein
MPCSTVVRPVAREIEVTNSDSSNRTVDLAELFARLAALVPPPRIHRHRCIGMLERTAAHRKNPRRRPTAGAGRYAQCSVMCRARTQQGCRPRECWRCRYPGRSCAAHNVCFLARRTEGKQSCHATATDTMTIAHRPHRIRPFVKVSPRQGPSNARDSNRSPHGWR